MAASVQLPRPADAVFLDAYVVHVEAALNKLVDTLGTGSADTVTVDSLKSEKSATITAAEGALAAKYSAHDTKVRQYHSDLDLLDQKVAEIATNSAQIANTTQAAVNTLVDHIKAILKATPKQPTPIQQLGIIESIDKAIGEADTTVTTAHADFVEHAQTTTTPPPLDTTVVPDTGGSTATPVYYPSNTSVAGSSLGAPAAAAPLTGGEKVQVQQIYKYLTGHWKLTPAQAAGILGNMQVESSFDTGAYNAGEGAIGLCQWEGGRRGALERFAAARGTSATNWQTQVDFLMAELQGGESSAFAQLKAAQTAGAAAAAFDQYYERSSGDARGQRVANAESIASEMAAVSA